MINIRKDLDCYAHLDELLIEAGEKVKIGDKYRNSWQYWLFNRPHLHYEVNEKWRKRKSGGLFLKTLKPNSFLLLYYNSLN